MWRWFGGGGGTVFLAFYAISNISRTKFWNKKKCPYTSQNTCWKATHSQLPMDNRILGNRSNMMYRGPFKKYILYIRICKYMFEVCLFVWYSLLFHTPVFIFIAILVSKSHIYICIFRTNKDILNLNLNLNQT